MLCALMYRQNGDLANLGGCNRYLGNAQIEVPLIGMGLPLYTFLQMKAILDILLIC